MEKNNEPNAHILRRVASFATAGRRRREVQKDGWVDLNDQVKYKYATRATKRARMRIKTNQEREKKEFSPKIKPITAKEKTYVYCSIHGNQSIDGMAWN